MATDHSATSRPPVEVELKESKVNLWQSLTLMAQSENRFVIIDTRSREKYDLFHAPNSVHLENLSANHFLENYANKDFVLVIGSKGDDTEKTVRLANKDLPKAKFFILKDGISNWYLTLNLPVPLFSDKPKPFGYDDALSTIKKWLANQSEQQPKNLENSINLLAKANYQPTLLSNKKKASSSKKKKKITGGCG